MDTTKGADLHIRMATVDDVPIIFDFIKELAEYERMLDEVVATEALLAETLFGKHPVAEVVLGFADGEAAGFVLFFYNYSTFLGRPGIYLEDLFVKPKFRRNGYGKKLLSHLAKLAVDQMCGRLEWAVLDWNTPAIDFYKSLGASPMDEWTTFRLTGENLLKMSSHS